MRGGKLMDKLLIAAAITAGIIVFALILWNLPRPIQEFFEFLQGCFFIALMVGGIAFLIFVIGLVVYITLP